MRRLASATIVLTALLLATLAAAPGVSAQATDEPRASDPSLAGSPTADTAGTAFPVSDEPVPVEPGTYRIPRSAWSVADLTVTFPEGWTVQYGHVFAGHPDEDDEFGFYPVVVDAIWPEACAGSDSGDPIVVGPSVADLAAALLQQPGPLASDPVETTLGGYPASRIDLTVPEDFALDACNAAGIGLQIWYSPAADKNFVLAADGSASVYILDVDGERQVFLVQRGSTTSDEDLAGLQAVLDSIRIERSPTPQPSVAAPSSPVETVLNGFLEARIAGEGAERYLNGPEVDIPLLYATTSGTPFERAEFERVPGVDWPYGWTAFQVRLFAGDTVVEQLFFTSPEVPRGLEYQPHGFGTHIAPTSEDGQPVAVPYTYFDGEVTLYAAHPWIFHDGWAGGRLIPEGPGVRPTTDGGERNDWDTLVLQVGSIGPPCQASVCDLEVDGGTGRVLRYYKIDAPEGSSMQTLTLVLSAPKSRFERAAAAAAPVIDSIDFRARDGDGIDRSQPSGAECHPMVDDCPMSEDCPVYDRDARMCLVHPGDCELSPADGEADLVIETSEVLTPDTSAGAMAG